MPLLPETLPGEKLLIKIVEEVSKGIGALGSPIISRWARSMDAKGDMKALRIKTRGIIQIKAEIKEILAGKKAVGENLKLLDVFHSDDEKDDHELAQAKRDLLEYLQLAGINIQNYVEVERQLNLLQIGIQAIEVASEDALQDTDAQAHVDDDWMAQWRNRAQDVSNETMQQLWAKILNEECRKPGSFSIQAINLLSTLSRDEADLVANLGRYVINETFLSSQTNEFLAAHAISFEQLLDLQDLGVLGTVAAELAGIAISFDLKDAEDGKKYLILRNNDLVLVLTSKAENIRIPAYSITRAGREILKLAACKGDRDYLKTFAETLRKIGTSALIGNRTSDPKQIENVEHLWKTPEDEAMTE